MRPKLKGKTGVGKVCRGYAQWFPPGAWPEPGFSTGGRNSYPERETKQTGAWMKFGHHREPRARIGLFANGVGQTVKHIGFFALGAWAVGLAAFSGPSSSGEARITVVSPEAGESAEWAPESRTYGFSGQQLLRLRELRTWLAERRLQRQDGVLAEPGRRPLDLSVYPDRQILTPLGQRYALGFQNRRTPHGSGNPTLFIGRGPDGRIYHRYDLGNSAGSPLWAGRDGPRRDDRAVGSRQRIVGMSPPEPRDQRAVPRLEYELEEPGR